MFATPALSPLATMHIEPNHNAPKKQLWWFKPPKLTNLRSSLNFKTNVQVPPYMKSNSFRIDDVSQEALTNQLSSLSLFLGSIFKEKSNKRYSDIIEEFGISGKFLENGLVFCQDFSIRSYEVGADGSISLETLISHLQETGLNHLKVTGLLGYGLGSTPEMCKRKLIWVSTKTQIAVDRYPTWGDTVQIHNWFVLPGKNSMRRDSVIRDIKTGEILVRAMSNFVMMNKETRRLCRFPNEVREEMSPFCKDTSPNLEDDSKKIPKLNETSFDYICTGLKPRWSDLDMNQHVNNAKYIGWILESAPVTTLKNHKLSRIILEYKQECQRDNILQSMTTVSSDNVVHQSYHDTIECHHLLKLEGGVEILKARTEWITK